MSKPAKFRIHFNASNGYWSINIPAQYSKTSKRSTLYFRDKAEALKAASRLREKTRKFGVSLSNLDPLRLSESSEAFKILDSFKERSGLNLGLLSCVRDAVYRQEVKSRSKSLLDVFNDFLDSIDHRSFIHRQQIMQLCRKLTPLHRKKISEIEAQEITDILSPFGKGTFNRYLTALTSVWNFAIRKEPLRCFVWVVLRLGHGWDS